MKFLRAVCRDFGYTRRHTHLYGLVTVATTLPRVATTATSGSSSWGEERGGVRDPVALVATCGGPLCPPRVPFVPSLEGSAVPSILLSPPRPLCQSPCQATHPLCHLPATLGPLHSSVTCPHPATRSCALCDPLSPLPPPPTPCVHSATSLPELSHLAGVHGRWGHTGDTLGTLQGHSRGRTRPGWRWLSPATLRGHGDTGQVAPGTQHCHQFCPSVTIDLTSPENLFHRGLD